MRAASLSQLEMPGEAFGRNPTSGLAYAGELGPAPRNGTPSQSPKVEQDKDSPNRSVVVQGNTKVGEVFFYPQIHRGFPHGGPACRPAVVAAQQLILKELLRSEIKHVFEEGRQSDLMPDSNSTKWLDVRVAACGEFKDAVLPEQLTAAQQRLLYRYGAAGIYWSLKKDVTIHRTNSPEEERRFNRVLDDPNSDPKVVQEYKFAKREQNAMREVMNFLDTNPGSRVAIVYGAAHHFSKESFVGIKDPEKLPMVVEIAFDTPKELLPLTKLPKDLEEQSKAVSSAVSIHISAYEMIERVEDKLIALSKLAGLVEKFDSSKRPDVKALQLRDYLEDHSKKDPKLMALIAGMYQTFRGPFADFKLRDGVNWQDVGNLYPEDMDKLLQNVQSVGTQELILKLCRHVGLISVTNILSAHGKEIAYHKLDFLIREGHDEEADELRDILKTYCRPRLHRDIDRDFQHKSGAFRRYGDYPEDAKIPERLKEISQNLGGSDSKKCLSALCQIQTLMLYAPDNKNLMAEIGKVREDLVNKIIPLLDRDKEELAIGASQTLATIGSPVVRPLLRLIADLHRELDKKVEDREALFKARRRERYASRALSALGVEAISELRAALEGEDKELRLASLSAIKELGEVAFTLAPTLLELKVAGKIHRSYLDELGPPAAPVLLAALEGGDMKKFHEALDSLSDIKDLAKSALPAVLKITSHPDPEVRRKAPLMLARIGPEAQEVSSAFKKLLGDTNAKVRQAAAQACEYLGPVMRELIPELLKIAESKREDNPTRETAVRALGVVGMNETIATRKMLRDRLVNISAVSSDSVLKASVETAAKILE